MEDIWLLNPSTFTSLYTAYLVQNRMLFHTICCGFVGMVYVLYR